MVTVVKKKKEEQFKPTPTGGLATEPKTVLTDVGALRQEAKQTTEAQQAQQQGVPGLVEERQQRVRETTREELGTEAFSEDLTGKIALPSERLKPGTPELGSEQAATNLIFPTTTTGFFGRLFTGQASNREINAEANKFATQLGVSAAVGGAFALGAGGAALLRAATAAKIGGGAGKLAAGIGVSTAGLGATFIGGRSIFDFKGGEISTLRDQLGRIEEETDKSLISAKATGRVDIALSELRTLSEIVNESERRLIELGNKNLQYRTSREYLSDNELIKKGRLSIRSKVDEIDKFIRFEGGTIPEEELLQIFSQI